MKKKAYKRGVTVVLVLVFMGIFGLIVSTVASYVFTQATVGRAKVAREEAVQIAEAGLEYYKWFLAHNPADLQNGTGAPGPYDYVVNDPEGGQIGTASISVSGNISCGAVQSVDITSIGSSDKDVQFKRTLFGRFAKPSVAEYAYIINSNVWAGSDRNIVGPYHSNGGIRMDGTNNSTVTSAVDDWLCTSSFGCSPNETVSGVWGAGSGSALWNYPVPQFNFAGLVVDLDDLKSKAQSDGIFLASFSGQSDRRGYHLILQPDNSVNVYQVNGTNWLWGYNSSYGYEYSSSFNWRREYNNITSESFVGNYVVPSNCPVIFSEEKIWLEGTVGGKITIAVADTLSSYDTDVIIHDDINYSTLDGSVGLTVLGEDYILISNNSPQDMIMRGIFVAQNGSFGRNYYSNNFRNSLNIHGSIVSQGRVGTKWTCSGSYCSGYNTRVNSYDRLLATDPPPFTPPAEPDEQFVLWRED
jgi:hypothetical protein